MRQARTMTQGKQWQQTVCSHQQFKDTFTPASVRLALTYLIQQNYNVHNISHDFSLPYVVNATKNRKFTLYNIRPGATILINLHTYLLYTLPWADIFPWKSERFSGRTQVSPPQIGLWSVQPLSHRSSVCSTQRPRYLRHLKQQAASSTDSGAYDAA